MSTLIPVAPVQIRSTIRRPWPLVPVAVSVMVAGVAVGVEVGVAVAVAVGVGLGATVAVGVAVGVGVGDCETNSLSVKASCCDPPAIATRPSTHEVACLTSTAEP